MKSYISEQKLNKINLPNGDIYKFIKKSDENFSTFGEIYFSWIHHDSVKAWKRHNKMIMNLTVPIGKVKFVFCENIDGPFDEYILSNDTYSCLTVKPGLWFGFQGVDLTSSLVVNLASIEHEHEEMDRLPIQDVKYKW